MVELLFQVIFLIPMMVEILVSLQVWGFLFNRHRTMNLRKSHRSYHSNFSPSIINIQMKQNPEITNYPQNAVQYKYSLNSGQPSNINRDLTRYWQEQIAQKKQHKAIQKQQNQQVQDTNKFLPFGKDRQKHSKQIFQKLFNNQDQKNKELLKKFRYDAIIYRNNRLSPGRSINKKPLITSTMLPDISQTHNYLEKSRNQNSIQTISHDHQKRKQLLPVSSSQLYRLKKLQSQTSSPEKQMEKSRFFYQSPTTSVVQTETLNKINHKIDQLSLKNRKYGHDLRNFKYSYKLQRQKDKLKSKQLDKSIDQISEMLVSINSQLKTNSNLIKSRLEKTEQKQAEKIQYTPEVLSQEPSKRKLPRKKYPKVFYSDTKTIVNQSLEIDRKEVEQAKRCLVTLKNHRQSRNIETS